MKLLRLTIFGSPDTEDDWMALWFTSQSEAEDYLAIDVNGTEAILESVEVPTSKEGLACAMNAADASFMAWPGQRIKTYKLEK